MLRRAGLPVAALDRTDVRVPADKVQALIADSARAASCEEFGLYVGRAFRLSMKGPLGLLMREQPNVRQALEALRRYLRYQNENVELRVEAEGDGLMVTPMLLSPRTRSSRLMVELTVTMYVQMFRALLGEDWRPVRVTFAHSAPADTSFYRRVLGEVEFRAGVNGLVLSAADLATPLPETDAEMAREIARYIETNTTPHAATAVDSVAALILRLLPEGICGVDEVAQRLGVDRRTIHRRLAAEGASFTQLLEAARREVAVEQLKNGAAPLGEVTALVGFASLSAFSRWFRQAYGIQPSEFRRLAQEGDA
jgi:AraC-like DNA-binding protein